MQELRLKASFAILAWAFALPTLAAPYPVPVQNAISRGAEVIAEFEAPANLTGYVLSFMGEHHVLYVTPDKGYAITGTMVNDKGENLTSEQIEEHVPRPPDYAAIWEEAEKSHWIAEGAEDPKTIIYALADPDCPYCHSFWMASQYYYEAGLQVRWLLISVLRPEEGLKKAAAILEAKDPATAFREHESSYDEGGITPLAQASPETVATVRANEALMEKLKAYGIPVVLFKDKSGEVHVTVGMPKLSALPKIFNLPQQQIDDPKLQQFK